MNYHTKAKPYNSLNEYNKIKYGFKVAKIPLNLDFSCPNKDGKKGYGGCIYCSKLASGDIQPDTTLDIKSQFEKLKLLQINKWKNIKLMAYLQAGSNTYKSIDELKKIYDDVLNVDLDLFGISIATRSDCLDDDIVELLSDINKKTHLQVELGFQTANEETSIYINRCLTNDEFIEGVNKLRNKNIEVIVHIINGLPNETTDDMLNTIKFLNKLDIQGIKIHSLLVLKDTKLYQEYQKNPFKLLTLEEYTKITAMQIAHLKDSIIIHRLAADAPSGDYMPLWPKRKMVVMNEIDKYMRANDLYQGKFYKE